MGWRLANIEWQADCMLGLLSGGVQLMWNMPVSILIMVHFRAPGLVLLQTIPCLSIRFDAFWLCCKGGLWKGSVLSLLCSDYILTALKRHLWTMPKGKPHHKRDLDLFSTVMTWHWQRSLEWHMYFVKHGRFWGALTWKMKVIHSILSSSDVGRKWRLLLPSHCWCYSCSSAEKVEDSV